jgi:hypothetical protein
VPACSRTGEDREKLAGRFKWQSEELSKLEAEIASKEARANALRATTGALIAGVTIAPLIA